MLPQYKYISFSLSLKKKKTFTILTIFCSSDGPPCPNWRKRIISVDDSVISGETMLWCLIAFKNVQQKWISETGEDQGLE